MQPQAFLTAVRDQAFAGLPGPLQGAQARIRYGMLQIHFGDPRIHYEVWLVRKTGRIEIGLHFESDRDVNEIRAAGLAGRALELREFLGPEAEIEAWSPSWTRLHLTLPLGPLEPELCSDVAERLAALVRLTGDEIVALPPRRPADPSAERPQHGRHWRQRRRGQATERL